MKSRKPPHDSVYNKGDFMFLKMKYASIIAAGSILNIYPAAANITVTRSYESDLCRLEGDWWAVGKDIYKALDSYDSEKEQKEIKEKHK